jgi:endonuclease/exonuclease/phosphatase (EEP) superfamily protein YafD
VCRVIWRRAAAVTACVLSGLAVASLAARTTRRRPPAGEGRIAALPVQAAALTPLATVGSVAAVALAATVAWWLAGLLAIPAALLAAGQLPRRRTGRSSAGFAPEPATASPTPPASAPAGPAALRVLTLNAMIGAADPAATVAAARRYDVDVLAIQELTPELAGRLAEAGLLDLLPFTHADPRAGGAGTGLWSRHELTPRPPVPGLRLASPTALITPGGQPVTVRAVHPVAPFQRRHRDWHRELNQLQAVLTATPGAQVVAGDFNASRDHRPFRDLLAAGFADCADVAARRPWPGFTWPANRWYPPVMRLDHILVSPGITVTEARTVAVPGTDHRGVLAVLDLSALARHAR